jgi:hypothetical protein
MELKFLRRKPIAEIHHPILHSARVQGEDDVKDAEGHGWEL